MDGGAPGPGLAAGTTPGPAPAGDAGSVGNAVGGVTAGEFATAEAAGRLAVGTTGLTTTFEPVAMLWRTASRRAASFASAGGGVGNVGGAVCADALNARAQAMERVKVVFTLVGRLACQWKNRVCPVSAWAVDAEVRIPHRVRRRRRDPGSV